MVVIAVVTVVVEVSCAAFKCLIEHFHNAAIDSWQQLTAWHVAQTTMNAVGTAGGVMCCSVFTSQVAAERTAWDMCNQENIKLITIQPSFILGPVISKRLDARSPEIFQVWHCTGYGWPVHRQTIM